HAYDGGTFVSVTKTYLDAVFARKLSCDTPATVPGCDDDVAALEQQTPGSVIAGSRIVGNYIGPITLDDDASRVYGGARDFNTLSAVAIDPDTFALSCADNSGSGNDCRKGALDLGPAGVLGPYSVVRGHVILPGQGHT